MTAETTRNTLLNEAQTLREAGQVELALAKLAVLEAAHPRFSRLFQERGHCHILQRDTPAAIAALRHAVGLNPTLPASWDMLAQLHRITGNPAGAAEAAQNYELLRQLPIEIVAANSLFADGDLAHAEDILRDYLARDPGNAGALRLIARIRTDCGDPADAERWLARAVAQAPDYHEARIDLANALLDQGKHAAAREAARAVLAAVPGQRDALKALTAANIGLGDHEPVIGLCESLLEGLSPFGSEVADLRSWRANALKTVGRSEEAIADWQAALVARPDYGAAWFALANLKTYRFSDAEITRMTSALGAPGVQAADAIYLEFALGKAREDRGDQAAAWAHYARGNALRSETARYRPEVAEAAAAAIRAATPRAFFAERDGWGADSCAPIFVLGLPRSGSTLVEQILASHSAVEGTQELTELGAIAADLCGVDPDCALPADPAALRRLTRAQARALGERYLAETRVYRRSDAPRFVDKMPANLWHIGLIALILPRATIIDVRRAPMACGFGNWKQLYGGTHNEFSYDLGHIARHTRAYLDVMRHWHTVLPGRVLTVTHEDLVTALEPTVRRLLDHCGLPFEPATLAFHENRRSVRTPSSEQVRQPVNPAVLDQWQAYAAWLQPLAAALGPALADWRD